MKAKNTNPGFRESVKLLCVYVFCPTALGVIMIYLFKFLERFRGIKQKSLKAMISYQKFMHTVGVNTENLENILQIPIPIKG